MGAEAFKVRVTAKSAGEAFFKATSEALHEYGHRGYTGTIAEKTEFGMESPRDGESPAECVRRCQHDSNHFSDDKWGAAACVDLGPDPRFAAEDAGLTAGARHIFVFFGWASS